MVLTRRRALTGAGLLLAGLSGCSSRNDATSTATAGERSYAETVDDPASRTVRDSTGGPAVRSTLADPVDEWADTHWLVADRDGRDALYFEDDAAGVDEALAFVDGTDFAAAQVLVHQHPVDACERWELDRLRWGEAGGDAPAGSGAVELGYRRVERDGDCEAAPRGDVAATFVRVPARFERLTRFGFLVS